MGLAYNVYLTSNKIFGCKQCKTHLADYDDIISRVSVHLFNDERPATVLTRFLAYS